jgi:nondiscriminating glutamyl-tRNA synthetase
MEKLRARGFEPEGVLNYLSLLGWSSEDEREVLSRAELVEKISLERVGRSDTVYDPEKLRWLSGQHIARLGTEQLVAKLRPFIDFGRFPLAGDALRVAVETIRTRLYTYGEVNEHLRWFFPDRSELESAQSQVRGDPQARDVLAGTLKRLREVEPWKPDALSAAVREAGKEMGVRGPALFHPVRKAVTGDESGPDIGGIMAALGREVVTERVEAALGIRSG